MSEFLENFVDGGMEGKTGMSCIDDISNDFAAQLSNVSSQMTSPNVRSTKNTGKNTDKAKAMATGTFYKKKDNIHVMFSYRGQDQEEIIMAPLRKSPMLFLNKSVIFYGPSQSGKTTAIYNYMYLMRSLFPAVFVFAPTNEEKHDFDKVVPTPLIYDDFGIKEIRNIYMRQRAATNIYNTANDPATLYRLFMRVSTANSREFYKQLEMMRVKALRKASQIYKDGAVRRAKTDEIEELFKNKTVRFYKHVIRPHVSSLLQSGNLTNEEKYALRYIDFNPRLLIIFDDSTVEILNIIKEGKKKVKGEVSKDNEVIKHFFFKGRWANITHWYAFHDDNHLDTDVRKNAFYSIFCDKQVALAWFTRQANNFTLMEKKRAEAVINAVFDEKVSPKFAKLVYSRLEKKFYYLVADKVPDFQMCSDTVRKYCEKVARRGMAMDRNNPYLSKFTVA